MADGSCMPLPLGIQEYSDREGSRRLGCQFHTKKSMILEVPPVWILTFLPNETTRYPLRFDGIISLLSSYCSLEETHKSSNSKKLELLVWPSPCDLRAPVFLKIKRMAAPKHAPSLPVSPPESTGIVNPLTI